MKKSKMTTKGGISFGLTIGSAGVATVLNVIFGMAVAFFLIYFFAGFVFSLVVMIVNAINPQMVVVHLPLTDYKFEVASPFVALFAVLLCLYFALLFLLVGIILLALSVALIVTTVLTLVSSVKGQKIAFGFSIADSVVKALSGLYLIGLYPIVPLIAPGLSIAATVLRGIDMKATKVEE